MNTLTSFKLYPAGKNPNKSKPEKLKIKKQWGVKQFI